VQGLQGIQGDTGTTGAAGVDGATGVQGIQGIKGDQGTIGTQGVQGNAGVDGADGVQGIQGIKGDTGTTGTAGISISKFASVPNISLETSITGNFNSSIFFTATSDGNYIFDVSVAGIVQTGVDYKLNAEIITGSSAITSQYVVASDATTYANKSAGRQYGFHIIGAAASVTTGTSFAIRVTIQIGAGTSTVYFSGRALINKVGSIG
jgi:hypothetical protein